MGERERLTGGCSPGSVRGFLPLLHPFGALGCRTCSDVMTSHESSFPLAPVDNVVTPKTIDRQTDIISNILEIVVKKNLN